MKTRTPRIWLDKVVLAVLVWTQQAHALLPVAKSTEVFDKRSSAMTGASLSAERQQAQVQLASRLAGVQVDYDPVTGAPAWISKIGYLSKATEEEIQRTGDLGLATNDPYRAIKAFLIENTALFGHGPEVLTDAAVASEFTSGHNGLRTVIWQQQLDGIPVFEAVLKGHVTRSGRLVNISSHFLPDIEKASGLDKPGRIQLESEPVISAAQALCQRLERIG